MTSFDAKQFRNTMSNFCTGVVIVAGGDAEHPAGFAAQSFVSVSLDPPLIAICPAKTSTSWPKIRDGKHFSINILGEHQKPVCDLFAKSGGNKFDDIDWSIGENGAPVIAGVLARIECTLHVEHDAGDHTIAVAQVTHLESSESEDSALLFYKGRYGLFQPA